MSRLAVAASPVPAPLARFRAPDYAPTNPYRLAEPDRLEPTTFASSDAGFRARAGTLGLMGFGIGSCFGLMMDGSSALAAYDAQPWLHATLSGGLAGFLWFYDWYRQDHAIDARIEMDGRSRDSSIYFVGVGNLGRSVRLRRSEADVLKPSGPGDRIDFATGHTTKAPDVTLAKHDRTLIESLANERRLVADFGESSLYGRPVLSVIDPREALARLSRGLPVHVIDGAVEEPAHRELRLSGKAANGGGHGEIAVRWADRTYHYRTVACTSARAVHDAKAALAGEPLPRELVGVYRDATHYTECVALETLSAARAWTYDATRDQPWAAYGYDEKTKRMVTTLGNLELGALNVAPLRADKPSMLGHGMASMVLLAAENAVYNVPGALFFAGLIFGAKKLGDAIARGR